MAILVTFRASRASIEMGKHIRIAGLLTVMAFHTGLLAYSAYWHSPVVDEVGHLPAGLSHWRFQRFDLYAVNPPLVRGVAVIPVLFGGFEEDWSTYSSEIRQRSEFALGRRFAEANPDQFMTAWRLARWMCIPFSLLGAATCFLWAKELFGEASGWAALMIWCTSPTVLGHASLMTPDAPAAALGVTACFLFRRWLQNPTWERAFAAGAVLGLTELSKFTWLVLYPLFGVAWVAWHSTSTPAASSNWRLEAKHIVAMLLLSLYVVNLGYSFEESFTPLGEFEFSSRVLSGQTQGGRDGVVGNRFRKGWMAKVPVPIPGNMLLGIDHINSEFEQGYSSYLRGEYKHGGWWYYYLYAMLVKIPAGTLCLLALAAIAAMRSRTRIASLREHCYLLLPAAGVLTLVSSQTGFNHHIRYVLPAFPFLFIFASQALSVAARSSHSTRCMAAVFLIWAGASSLLVYPHSLSYFNEPSGGPENGRFHLNFSNTDWGQDLLLLKSWQEDNRDKQPLYVLNRHFIPARLFGIESTPLPQRLDHVDLDKMPRPGWYAITVDWPFVPNKSDSLDWSSASVVAGYSMRIFDFTAVATAPNRTMQPAH